MFTLKRGDEKIETNSAVEKTQLVAQGFELVSEKSRSSSQNKARTASDNK